MLGVTKTGGNEDGSYSLKTDNIMKNMFTAALKDELTAQSQRGMIHPETEAILQKVRAYELSEKRLPITTEEQRELRNALNRCGTSIWPWAGTVMALTA